MSSSQDSVRCVSGFDGRERIGNVPSVMLFQARYSTNTAAVSSNVATNVPSIAALVPCIPSCEFWGQANRRMITHIADDAVQQEEVQLAQHEEHGGEEVEEHRPVLPQHPDDDPHHEDEIE